MVASRRVLTHECESEGRFRLHGQATLPINAMPRGHPFSNHANAEAEAAISVADRTTHARERLPTPNLGERA